jgi:hypothetical protein
MGIFSTKKKLTILGHVVAEIEVSHEATGFSGSERRGGTPSGSSVDLVPDILFPLITESADRIGVFIPEQINIGPEQIQVFASELTSDEACIQLRDKGISKKAAGNLIAELMFNSGLRADKTLSNAYRAKID